MRSTAAEARPSSSTGQTRSWTMRAGALRDLTAWGDKRFFDERRHFQPLWKAFQLYELAREAKTSAARAQLIFGGNLLITAVEQDLVNEAYVSRRTRPTSRR